MGMFIVMIGIGLAQLQVTPDKELSLPRAGQENEQVEPTRPRPPRVLGEPSDLNRRDMVLDPNYGLVEEGSERQFPITPGLKRSKFSASHPGFFVMPQGPGAEEESPRPKPIVIIVVASFFILLLIVRRLER